MILPQIHRTFLQNSSSYNNFTKEKCSIYLDQQCQDSNLLTTTPILIIAYPNKDVVVCIDASKEGLGGVLTQEGHVICYES